ncbi:MAG: PD40 domain-containing protein [Alphaproteobacteria bacterium]|nr:PD40 domain-containing protein [Alphaproteobacteria bacterium]
MRGRVLIPLLLLTGACGAVDRDDDDTASPEDSGGDGTDASDPPGGDDTDGGADSDRAKDTDAPTETDVAPDTDGDTDPPVDTDPPPTFTVTVDPPRLELETGPDGAAPATFTASVLWSDGTTVAPGPTTWSVSNAVVGTVDTAGVFTASVDIGGTTDVIATIEGVEGRAVVVSRWVEVLDDPGVDATWFDVPSTPLASPAWTYPEDGTVLPRNVASVKFQWTTPPAKAYKLVFSTDVINLTVYTTELSWTALTEDWERITRSNAGSEVKVELYVATESGVFEAVPLTLGVDSFDAAGSVVYWSTSVSGMMEIPFGQPARSFFTSAEAGSCVGCHVISSRGIMAYNRGGSGGTLGMYDVSSETETYTGTQAAQDGRRTHYSTFSPDGAHLLTAFQGTLTLLDGETSAVVDTVLTASTVTQPDWSPAGDQVVFVRSTPCNSDIYLCKAGTNTLERMTWDGQAFGTPEVIHTAPAGELAYYPTHSPDGKWLVFNRSTGDSYDDPDASLWVIPADGSRAAVALGRANATGDLYNSWPRFAPSGTEGQVFWVAFASRRGYDSRGLPQIWVSAFDRAAADAGEDPSRPAFWLAGQSQTQNNHIPAWVDVAPPSVP